MCGIVGACTLNRKSINVNYAKSMTDKIAHRGPDDAGYLFFHTGCRHDKGISFFLDLADNKFKQYAPLLPRIQDEYVQRELNSHDWDLFFGHRRLAILDLTPAGHQPMSDLSKNIWIVYNGEIYNFIELRNQLQKLGYSFRTRTDTEVVIYSYIEWGIDCVKKFNGMFAFAIYDNFKKKLFLARDRYGIKPLYYTLTPTQTLIFASEIKSILEYKEFSPEIDLTTVYEYFTFQNIFTDKTFWKDIKILPPAHYIEIGLSTYTAVTVTDNCHSHSNYHCPLSLIKYWDFDFSNPLQVKDEREYIEELDRLFHQAVERQLIADVEIGAYLSGGMDSGAITAIASKYFSNTTTNTNTLKTFTIGFDLHSASGLELGYDEREKAEFISYLCQTEHYEMVLKAGDMEKCLNNLVWHLEEPRVGQSYPNYYASKLASRFVKVILAGTGGDELFAGYPWRYYRAVNNKNFDEYIDKYYKFWQRLIPNRYLNKMFEPIKDKVEDVWTRDIFKDILVRMVSDSVSVSDRIHSSEEYINMSLYFEAKTFLHGLLIVEDKLSMAHSLETRVPFLDNDLVNFAQKIPVRFKLRDIEKVIKIDENEPGKLKKYYEKTDDGKIILRKVLSKYVPEKITNQIKQGFSAPDSSWFKGESIEYIRKTILNKKALIFNFFDYDTVNFLVREHLEGKVNRRLFIWSLINFEWWLRIFNNGK